MPAAAVATPIRGLVDKCRDAVAAAHLRWVEQTGEVDPPLCANEWQLINHLAKWAWDEGLIDRLEYRGEAARLLCALPAEAKREVWGEALWYLEQTLPERFHPIRLGTPETGEQLEAWLGRVASAAGGRIGELMRDWAARRKYPAEMATWSKHDVAEALAEARRLMDFTDGMKVEVLYGRDGHVKRIRAEPLE